MISLLQDRSGLHRKNIGSKERPTKTECGSPSAHHHLPALLAVKQVVTALVCRKLIDDRLLRVL